MALQLTTVQNVKIECRPSYGGSSAEKTLRLIFPNEDGSGIDVEIMLSEIDVDNLVYMLRG